MGGNSNSRSSGSSSVLGKKVSAQEEANRNYQIKERHYYYEDSEEYEGDPSSSLQQA